jgi:MYXO-CTERM domain-containing protein
MTRSGVLAVGFLSLTAGRAAADPHGVRLTYHADPATSVAVSWNSDQPGDGAISWGTDPGSLSGTATAAHTVQPDPLQHSFTAQLSGLEPDTTYYYRVAGYPAEPLSFRTAPADPCAPLRFVLMGDNRQDIGNSSNPIWEGVLEEALEKEPDFFVNTGDMVKDGDNPTQWSNFIRASEPGFARVPSILTMGNHDADEVDGDGALYNQLYELPRNPVTGGEEYYSIEIGPIHFVSLNTQYNDPGSTEWTDMLAWLDADLAASQQPWTMVFFHKAVYSRGNHSSGEENEGEINRALIPIFDAHQVDFVMNGHSHNYERYAPSRGLDEEFGGSGRTFTAGPGSSMGEIIPDGTVGSTYMVAGGAGAFTTDIPGLDIRCIDAACTLCTEFYNSCPDEVYDNDVTGTVVYDGRHNFAVFDVQGGRIRVETWSTRAGNFEQPELIDQFEMQSASAVECGDGGGGGGGGDSSSDGDAGTGGEGDGPDGEGGGGAGCACRAGGSSPAGLVLLGLALLVVRRRRI